MRNLCAANDVRILEVIRYFQRVQIFHLFYYDLKCYSNRLKKAYFGLCLYFRPSVR